MRVIFASIAMAALVACSGDDGGGSTSRSVEITDPVEGATLTAAVVLTVHGVLIAGATQLKVTVDNAVQQMSSFDETFPDNCADCMFTVTLARVTFVNGSRRIGLSVMTADGEISDAVTVTINRI